MRQTACGGNKAQSWTHGMALERTYGVPRGMLLSRAPNADTLLERVLAATRIDGDALRQLTRMLTVTVRDWTGQMRN